MWSRIFKTGIFWRFRLENPTKNANKVFGRLQDSYLLILSLKRIYLVQNFILIRKKLFLNHQIHFKDKKLCKTLVLKKVTKMSNRLRLKKKDDFNFRTTTPFVFLIIFMIYLLKISSSLEKRLFGEWSSQSFWMNSLVLMILMGKKYKKCQWSFRKSYYK